MIESIEKYKEKKIIKYISSKNEVGIEMLIDNYGSFIKSIVYSKLGNHPECCDECINDIYIAIWKNINQFDSSKNSLKNWIAGVCRYKTIDYLRIIYRHSKNADIDSIKEIGVSDSEIEKIESDIYYETERLLKGLSEEDRNLIIDLYINDVSIDELSEILSMDKKAIYNKIYYIKNKLKKRRDSGNE